MNLRLLLCTLAPLFVSACSGRQSLTHVKQDAAMDMALGRGVVPAAVAIEPADGSRSMVRAIDKAQQRIFVETYILTDTRVARALERAAAEGVAVYVILEHHPLGMGPQPERMADRLRAAGIMVRWSRPGFELTHAKFVVLDDRLAIVSSANFSRSAFRRNRDFLVFEGVRGDVRAISGLFRADWDRLPAAMRDPNLLVSPDNARYKLLALIASARTSIDLYAEEIADAGVERALGAATERGVSVRVILPWGGSPRSVALLMRSGVRVGELRSPYIHAKLLSVDGREAYVGSENLSTASLDRNRELGILLRGRVIRQLGGIFSEDWNRALVPSTR